MKKTTKTNLKIKIAPSILSADFSNLKEELKKISDADVIHIDVMDGHFVNNITIGPFVVKAIRKITKKPLDVHLMIENPEKYVEAFATAGANKISFHPVATKDPKGTIKKIKSLGCEVGVVINPDKTLESLKPYLNDVDFVLIMSVYAGFGGQKFISEVLEKVQKLRNEYNWNKDIEIDGGINDETIRFASKAGANVFVAGNYVFGHKSPNKAIELLRKNASIKQ